MTLTDYSFLEEEAVLSFDLVGHIWKSKQKLALEMSRW